MTIEGKTFPLPDFFVVATQNPVEFRGTYPLPEAQMDRFAMRLALGYLDATEEVAILTAQQSVHPLDAVKPCASLADLRALRAAARAVRVSEEVKRYVVDLARATRTTPSVQLGAGPRASIALLRASQALALLDGEAFVHPEHVRELARPVLAHRLALDPQARYGGLTGDGIVRDVMAQVPLPA